MAKRVLLGPNLWEVPCIFFFCSQDSSGKTFSLKFMRSNLAHLVAFAPQVSLQATLRMLSQRLQFLKRKSAIIKIQKLVWSCWGDGYINPREFFGANELRDPQFAREYSMYWLISMISMCGIISATYLN